MFNSGHWPLNSDKLNQRCTNLRLIFKGLRRMILGDSLAHDEGKDRARGNPMLTWLQDFRYALRQLRRNPGFAGAAILILGLGIGATTAIFSAVNPILFEPLPYPNASRIVMIWYAAQDGNRIPQTFHTYRELAERNRAFEEVAVMRPWQPTLTGAEQPERLDGQQVSANYFRTLGVAPALGRDFQAADDIFRGPRVVMLSDVSWHGHFGADPEIVGRDIKLNGDSYIVIGVMPSSFNNILAPSAEFWSPLQYDSSNITTTQTREWGHHLRIVARMRPGVSITQARSDLDTIARSRVAEFPRPPWASLSNGLVVNSLQADVAAGVKPALLAVAGAVMLVLLIACVNVTNLLLARGAQRRGEFAMRVALGAARPRLIRQLLTESLLLALLGGALGMVVAQFGVRALVALSPPGLPRVDAIRLDTAAFVFALGITTRHRHRARSDPRTARFSRRLASWAATKLSTYGGRPAMDKTYAGRRRSRDCSCFAGQRRLAVAQLATSIRDRSRLRFVTCDHDAGAGIGSPVRHRPCARRFFRQALEAVSHVPGVETAAFTSQLPLSGDFDSYGVQFESDQSDNADAGLRYAVSPDYFKVLHIPLRRGRLLDEHDVAGAPLAVLLSESFAKRKFPGQDPLGKRLRLGPDIGHADRPWATVVGVVGDVKQASLALGEPNAFYTSTSQWTWVDRAQSLVVRTRGDAASVDFSNPRMRSGRWIATSLSSELPLWTACFSHQRQSGDSF